MKPVIFTILSLGLAASVSASDLKIKNRVYIDADWIGPYYQKGSDANTDSELAFEIASLKSSIKYALTKSIDAKVQIEYKKEEEDDYQDDIRIKDAYLSYDLDAHQFMLGRFKEPMGHEENSSSRKAPAIERSLVSTSLSPGRNIGLQYQFNKDAYTLQVGQFVIEDDDIENGQATTGRAIWHPTLSILDESPFHFGVAASKRSFDDSLIQYKERGEVNTADNIIRSARYRADEQTLLQTELGFVAKDIWLMGEFYQTELSQINDTSWQYQGFYVQAIGAFNWFKPERTIRYQYKNAEFKQPKMKQHDIEWVIRYSGLDLRDNDTGAEAASLLVGANYYLNINTSLMLNALMPTISGNVVNTNHDGPAISMRFRYFW